ncbi:MULTISPECIES: HD domain-containing protein [Cyanophyceae]|uniref:HD domain-containing protein n=1 Tax=Cyanophyceae TaxID=3028117 RepID=UPI00016DC6E5|nr:MULTISPECIES: HD domain-containing protein [Cyanophyceae]ACA98726.1 HD domain protein [Picosynechococcus sp. PCC 7002]SMH39426.1 HD domain-containing protein [Picosynechococcus sp. OG1]SMQ78189.1 HD domain-containing protein [Synechococcus sp. 7002]
MKIWDQDKYQKAWNFASNAHNGQKLPGSDIPYINHLGLVAMEATATVAHERIDNPNILVLCALLHDVIEDTSTTFEDVKRDFGIEIADGVLALTKNTELPSKFEQMKDSINRIQLQPKEVWMVKLCDRITNLQPPPMHWDKVKIATYQSEAQFILEQLGEASPFLAQRLIVKISDYDQYL